MSTPAMVAASMLKLMVVCLSVFWSISFITGRVFVFYEAYTNITLVQRQDEWLRLQCSEPGFYTNMRQHADLCAKVQLNFERIPLLVGLNAVANTAHLCGRHSCADAIIYLSNGGWPVLVTVALTCLFAPYLLSRGAGRLIACDSDRYSAQLPMGKMA